MRENIKKRPGGGFTILETLAVASIATVVGSIAVSAAVNLMNFQRVRWTDNRLGDARGALIRYFSDVGSFPATTTATNTPAVLNGVQMTAFDGPTRLATDNTAGWQGPYLKRGRLMTELSDAWGRPFYYRTGSDNGVDLALLVSAGINGVVESDLTNWTTPTWTASGDDQVVKVSSQEIARALVDSTVNLLQKLRNQLETQFPMRAPATFPTPLDSWGNPIVYFRCSQYSAVVYSYSMNRTDDSSGGATICNTGMAGGDDLSEFVPWSPYGRLGGLLNDGWTGGMQANQAVCGSYTYVAVNNLNDPLTVSYYDANRNPQTTTVAAGTTAYIGNVYPYMLDSTGYGSTAPLSVYRNGIRYDAFIPTNADLNQECRYQKVFNNTTGK